MQVHQPSSCDGGLTDGARGLPYPARGLGLQNLVLAKLLNRCTHTFVFVTTPNLGVQ